MVVDFECLACDPLEGEREMWLVIVVVIIMMTRGFLSISRAREGGRDSSSKSGTY